MRRKIRFDNGLKSEGLNIIYSFHDVNDRKAACKAMLSGFIPENIIERLVEETSFLYAPASTVFHGNYEGGLFDHSWAVATILKGYTDRLDLKWQDERSPIVVGLFHDLCKMDSYVYDTDNKRYEWNSKQLLTAHGLKSVIASQVFLNLTEEEIACIAYHMGAFTSKEEWNDYTNAVEIYPNVLYTHTADMEASRIWGI